MRSIAGTGSCPASCFRKKAAGSGRSKTCGGTAGGSVVTLQERAARVRLLILDVDGVLTDGRIVYDNFGDELKFFDVQDGMGLYLLHKAGIPCVIITAKQSRLVKRRAKEMWIARLYQNAHDKLAAYEDVKRRFGVSDEAVGFVGDDIVDLPLMRRVGLAVAVPYAIEEIRQAAHWVTQRQGGRGAIREVVDVLLKARGVWDLVTAFYRR